MCKLYNIIYEVISYFPLLCVVRKMVVNCDARNGWPKKSFCFFTGNSRRSFRVPYVLVAPSSFLPFFRLVVFARSLICGLKPVTGQSQS